MSKVIGAALLVAVLLAALYVGLGTIGADTASVEATTEEATTEEATTEEEATDEGEMACGIRVPSGFDPPDAFCMAPAGAPEFGTPGNETKEKWEKNMRDFILGFGERMREAAANPPPMPEMPEIPPMPEAPAASYNPTPEQMENRRILAEREAEYDGVGPSPWVQGQIDYAREQGLLPQASSPPNNCHAVRCDASAPGIQTEAEMEAHWQASGRPVAGQ